MKTSIVRFDSKLIRRYWYLIKYGQNRKQKENLSHLAHKELGDGKFETAADLEIIPPDVVQAISGSGTLCLWGEDHVVFQTSFVHHGHTRLHVKNIHSGVSKQIEINFRVQTIMVTMNAHLIVFMSEPDINQVFMMSFSSPDNVIIKFVSH